MQVRSTWVQLGYTSLVWATYRHMKAAVMVEGTSPCDDMLAGEKGVLRGLELELMTFKWARQAGAMVSDEG